MCNLFERIITRQCCLLQLLQISKRLFRENNRRRTRTRRRCEAGFGLRGLSESRRTCGDRSNEAKQQRVILAKTENGTHFGVSCELARRQISSPNWKDGRCRVPKF